MIKLTHSYNGRPLYVAPEHITCMGTTRMENDKVTATFIHYIGDGGEPMCVAESPEYVLAAIKRSKEINTEEQKRL